MYIAVTGAAGFIGSNLVKALNARGDALRNRLNAAAKQARFPMQFTGLGSMMNVHMCPGAVRSVRDLERSVRPLADLFYFHMLDRRVWMARRGMINLSLPIGDTECDHLVHAVEGFVASCNALMGK